MWAGGRVAKWVASALLSLMLFAGVWYYKVGQHMDLFGRNDGPPEVAVDENPLLQGSHGSRILIASAPPGATVFLDGEKTEAITPASLTGLMPETYQVRVEKPGFASWSSTVRVARGETVGVTAALLGKQGGAQPGTAGRMLVETTPPSTVLISGDPVGRTPLNDVYAPLGRVTLDFELDDGRKFTRDVVVKNDRTVRAQFDFTNAKK